MFNRLKSREHFSFSKYADGEWAIITNANISNGEFDFNKKDDQDDRQKLIESYLYVDDGYYVGISCPCCVGINHFYMRKYCPSDDEHITFANIFVNTNYSFYKENFIPEYSNWDIHLVANKSAKIDNLPFKIKEFYPVENSAIKNSYHVINDIKFNKPKDSLVLFACGPFGNVLAHQLWKWRKDNTYLDIGSTLNPWLQCEGFKRDYYLPYNTGYAKRNCIWGN